MAEMSVTGRVARYLERDWAMADVLARGVLNLRRAAQWFIETQEWAVTEESIVSALRRYEPELGVDPGEAMGVLSSGPYAIWSRRAVVRVSGREASASVLSEVGDTLNPRARVAVLPGREGLVLVVKQERAEAVGSRVAGTDSPEVVDGLDTVTLRLSGDSAALDMVAVAGVLNALAHQGVRLHGFFGYRGSLSLLGSGSAVSRALDVVRTQASRVQGTE